MRAPLLLLPLAWSAVRDPLTIAASARAPAPTAADLQSKVNAAIAAGAPTVTIEGGEYHFGPSNFNIADARDLAILAPDPVTLWFGATTGVNISNCSDLSVGNWTIDNENYAGEARGGPAITLNLLNCTRVSVADVALRRGYGMILTAFNGGGDHKFTRLKFEPTLQRLTRDAIHFSDQRVGPTIVDSVVGYTADDLFNIHTTLMVVLKCDAPSSCLMVNPHLSGPETRNTVYGTNSVLEMVTPGLDKMSFFSWPTTTFDTARYPGAPLGVRRTERIGDAALLAEAATLVPELEHHGKPLNPVSMTNDTVGWQAWDLWRVNFEGAVPAGVGRAALVQIDTISNAGTRLENNLFTDTNCNLGRFKSSDSLLRNNVFRNASIPSLELAWLPQFFEGPVILTNVTIRDNVVQGEGAHPIHCGPFCGSQTCLYSPGTDRPTGTWTPEGCPQCPDCAAVHGETPWTKNIRLINNTIVA